MTLALGTNPTRIYFDLVARFGVEKSGKEKCAGIDELFFFTCHTNYLCVLKLVS